MGTQHENLPRAGTELGLILEEMSQADTPLGNMKGVSRT